MNTAVTCHGSGTAGVEYNVQRRESRRVMVAIISDVHNNIWNVFTHNVTTTHTIRMFSPTTISVTITADFRSYSVSQVLQPQHGGASSAQGQPPAAKPPVVPAWKRPTHPPVRIDTCIVGDDSTCDAAQHERCRTELGVSSCLCRPGYSRRKHRDPCHST